MPEMMHGEGGRSEAKQSEPTVAETKVWGDWNRPAVNHKEIN